MNINGYKKIKLVRIGSITIFEPFYSLISFFSILTPINRFSICQTHIWNPDPQAHRMVYWTTSTSLIFLLDAVLFLKIFLKRLLWAHTLRLKSWDTIVWAESSWTLRPHFLRNPKFLKIASKSLKTCAGFSYGNPWGWLMNL